MKFRQYIFILYFFILNISKKFVFLFLEKVHILFSISISKFFNFNIILKVGYAVGVKLKYINKYYSIETIIFKEKYRVYIKNVFM